MNGEERHSRLQDLLQSGLILFLTVLLLFTGSTSVNYMVKSASMEARYETLKNENRVLIEGAEQSISLGIERRIKPLESRVDTLERRVRQLERELFREEQYIP